MNNENKKSSIWKKIFALPLWYIVVFILFMLGQFLGALLLGLVIGLGGVKQTAVWETAAMYAIDIGVWVLFPLVMWVLKYNRPMLEKIGTAARGNHLKRFLLGLLLGFGMNILCAVVAMLHKDIYLYFDAFDPLPFVLVFLAVFIQSSAEELICRCYLYEKLRRGYIHPAVAIFGNSLFFALVHLTNTGVTALSILNIFLFGVLCSLLVYYYDSLWCAFALHTAWNFTQNILLGLPNSGVVVRYSVFKLDAANATNSFAYNTAFGIEGTVIADLVLLAACVGVYLHGSKRKSADG